MTKINIGTRILLGFGAVVAMTLGLGWYGLAKLAQVRYHTSEIETRDFVVLNMVEKISHSEEQMRLTRERALTQYLLHRARLQEDGRIAPEQEWRQADEQAEKLLNELESTVSGYEERALSPRRGAQWRKIRQEIGNAMEALKRQAAEVKLQFGLMSRSEPQQILAREPVLEEVSKAFQSKMTSVIQLTQEQIEIGRAETGGTFDEAKLSTLIAMILTLVVGVICTVVIQRSITRPLALFMQFVERIGQGDLTQQAAVLSRDEIGVLAQSLNQMAKGLNGLAAQTRTVTENLNSATAEILASTQQQAAGTAEQSAAVQQTSATMQEVSQSGAQISERAKQVAASAEATGTASKSGLQAVQNMTRAMDAIREQAEAVAENIVSLSEKTQAVGEIIATVNDIAEQSNLLALNATIGAAAAGEQGRTFAVVANEMKNLADQAKTATVQVRSILGDIQKGINTSVMLTEEAVKRVESGKQQTDVAEQTIRHMADNIDMSVQAFQQIVAATNQQQIGFDQVAQSLNNINTATAQTAASTRQLEKAAANLNALGQQLKRSVESYRI
jgi:methyl-accepting chemotaxis protein